MRTLLLLASLACASAVPCFADTVFVLNNAVLTNGTTASGTFNINPTTGVFDGASLSTVQGGSTYTFTSVYFQQENFQNTQSFAYFADQLGDYFIVDLPSASLVGYAGGNLCSVSNTCGGYVSGFVPKTGTPIALQSGSAAVTPEPSSLALLGTGLLGFVGVARRRFTRAA